MPGLLGAPAPAPVIKASGPTRRAVQPPPPPPPPPDYTVDAIRGGTRAKQTIGKGRRPVMNSSIDDTAARLGRHRGGCARRGRVEPVGLGRSAGRSQQAQTSPRAAADAGADGSGRALPIGHGRAHRAARRPVAAAVDASSTSRATRSTTPKSRTSIVKGPRELLLERQEARNDQHDHLGRRGRASITRSRSSTPSRRSSRRCWRCSRVKTSASPTPKGRSFCPAASRATPCTSAPPKWRRPARRSSRSSTCCSCLAAAAASRCCCRCGSRK